MSNKFEGYLPSNAFVMARKAKLTTESSTAAASSPASFGEGDPASPLIFVGGLGGPNGPLLDKMIEAMGKKRSQVFITPLLSAADAALCVQTLKPKVVVALGKPAAQSCAALSSSATQLIATHHPDEMVTNPNAKKECWEQLKIAMNTLGWKR